MVGDAFVEQRRFWQRIEAVARQQLADLAVDGRLIGFEQREDFRGDRFLDLAGQLADPHQQIRIGPDRLVTEGLQDHEQLVAPHPQLAAHAGVPAQLPLELDVTRDVDRTDPFEQP
ncbi:MAG: hypothetical protein AB7O55_28695 [Lautropia sp.]